MAWPSWTPRARLAQFMQGTTRHCYILNVDHKTLLYTKCINYGPHRKDFLKFLSMRAVDNQGLGQFAPKESTQTLDIATYYMASEDFFP